MNAHDRAPLEEAAAYAAERGVSVRTELLVGDIVDEIVAYADSFDVDLIVVASRGHGALATALLGSVSRGILHNSSVRCLVVRSAAISEPAIV